VNAGRAGDSAQADTRGPYVGIAVLCDRVEARDDGTIDIHGIVDGLVVEPRADDALDLQPHAVLDLTVLVNVRAGGERGAHRLAIRGVYPSGTAGPELARSVEFTDERPGAGLIVPLSLEIHEEGLYHFDVEYDGRRLTSIPLRVLYAPLGPEPSARPQPP
jgi:hypothetical protein